MKIADHEISKVCNLQDPDKYLGISNQPLGYAKLCCYAVKILRNNNILTSYENICVALWIMFPDAQKFHLAGFEAMPDTDFMEKLIKLRSTPKQQGYLTGGNYRGNIAEFGNPWNLTRKGDVFAKEVEEILSSKVAKPLQRQPKKEQVEVTVKGTINYETRFRPILESKLFKKFLNGQKSNQVEATSICSALDIYYSSDSFRRDFEERLKFFRDLIQSIEKDGVSNKKIDKCKNFLDWLESEDIKLG